MTFDETSGSSDVRLLTPTQDQVTEAARRVVNILKERAEGETTLRVVDLSTVDVLCTLDAALSLCETLLDRADIPLQMLDLADPGHDPR